MPFTLSHAVAVLPAMRRTGAARGPLIASALVLGTFAPDVPFFLGLWSFGGLAHSPLGLVTVDVLITLVLFGFWSFAREPLIALAPSRWGSRIVAAAGPGRLLDRSRASVAVWFAISAAIGSATHVAWDAFTHAGRFGVRAFPVLAEPVLFDRPLFTFLQYGSSALGLVVLAVYLVRLSPPDRPIDLPTWPASTRAVVLGVLAASCLLPGVATFLPFAHLGFDTVAMVAFAAGGGLGFGLAVYAVGARLYWAVSGRTPQVEEAE